MDWSGKKAEPSFRMRETEQAIGLVIKQQEPVELAPQNAYIRRLQHQMPRPAKTRQAERLAILDVCQAQGPVTDRPGAQ